MGKTLIGGPGRWTAEQCWEAEILQHIAGLKPYGAHPKDWRWSWWFESA